jgi:sporulation protein YlmC with PRC-barrel domain
VAGKHYYSKGERPVLEHQGKSIIGKPVENEQGDYLGKITDLMISPENGGMTFAVLSHGGILGIPMRFVAVPFESLAFSPGKNVYLLNVSRERMAAAPGFNRGYWPDVANREWDQDIYKYYGQTPPWGGSEESIPASQDQAIRFNQIMGVAVRNEQGEELGRIDDIIIDSHGHVPFGIVAHGGFLGMDQKFVAVPFWALKFEKRETEFVLNSTKEKLDAAPAFKATDLAHKKWIEDTQRIFGP